MYDERSIGDGVVVCVVIDDEGTCVGVVVSFWVITIKNSGRWKECHCSLHCPGVEKSVRGRCCSCSFIRHFCFLHFPSLYPLGPFKGWLGLFFVFVFLSSGFYLVLALVAHVCYCLFFVFCLFGVSDYSVRD